MYVFTCILRFGILRATDFLILFVHLWIPDKVEMFEYPGQSGPSRLLIYLHFELFMLNCIVLNLFAM